MHVIPLPPPQLHSITDKFNLNQVVSTPTRISSQSSTTIDHVYLTEETTLTSCETLKGQTTTVSLCHWIFPQLTRGSLVGKSSSITELTLSVPTVLCSASLHHFSQKKMLTHPGSSGMIFSRLLYVWIVISPSKRRPYFTKELGLLVRRKQQLHNQAKCLNSPCSWLKCKKSEQAHLLPFIMPRQLLIQTLCKHHFSKKNSVLWYISFPPTTIESKFFKISCFTILDHVVICVHIGTYWFNICIVLPDEDCQRVVETLKCFCLLV